LRSKVVFADSKVKSAYEKLKDGRSEDEMVLNWLNIAFNDLEKDPFCGIQIPKKLIPKKYQKEFGIENLWKYDLPNG
jgi:hypothetical protein